MIVTSILLMLVEGVQIFQYDGTKQMVTQVVSNGEAYQILLNSDQTSGFRWSLVTQPSFSDYHSTDSYGDYFPPARLIAGAVGKQAFTFMAKQAGTETLRFVYQKQSMSETNRFLDVVITVVDS